MTSEDRLRHDIENGINRRIHQLIRYPGSTGYANAAVLADQRGNLVDDVLSELRIRWTIIERPRKQTTHRQDS